jgi:hypothetical protein
MPVEDAAATRMVRCEVARRYIDATKLEIHVTHGVVYMRGYLRRLRTHPDVDLQHEMEHITHMLRGRQGIREIIWEVDTRER